MRWLNGSGAVSYTHLYDELMEVKKPILMMEQQIRELEIQMKHRSGEALEALYQTYSRLNHEFELMNGYAWQSEITGVLKGLGFTEDEFKKPVKELSGGQKTRVSLGKLLLSKPDIILLDEPTNHLDMESITWLEGYLTNYAGTVVIVAHDLSLIHIFFSPKQEPPSRHESSYSQQKAL